MVTEINPGDLRSEALAAIASSTASSDPDYPLFHLAPPVGRLNDPNGLLHWQGTYHACYQFSPFHPHRKLVYWGHASSPDLTHWTHHEPAIVPDSPYDANGAYSGSAVVHEGIAYFAYTGNLRPSEDTRIPSQCLVTSPDLRTFTKLAANPVISGPPPGYTSHVRDPQVWRDTDGTFRMCLGAQREDETGCALLLRSPDLLTWTLEGELTFPGAEDRFGALGYMWECPLLLRVPDVDGEHVHDVLIFCPQGADPGREGFENIFPACYVVGRLEGTALHEAGDYYEIDRGFEFYAPQTFASDQVADDGDAPVGVPAPVMLAWAGNASEDRQPSIVNGWVHLMSVPRELWIRDGRLVQRPQVDLSAAAPVPEALPATVHDEQVRIAGLSGSRSFALRFEIDATHASEWALRIGSAELHLDLTVSAGSLVVDRSRTRYPHGDRRVVTLPETDTMVVEVFHDRSITEVFLADGDVTFTTRSYLDASACEVTLRANGEVALAGVVAHRFD